MRVVVESPCEKCGNTHVGERIVDAGCFGSGGSRRVLTPGEFVLVEKVDGEWPDHLRDIDCWFCDGMGEVVHDEPCDVCTVDPYEHVKDCPECEGSGSLIDALVIDMADRAALDVLAVGEGS